MQYLLKIQIENTRAWRLLALDGEYLLAKIMNIISLSFEKDNGSCSLNVFDKIYKTKYECAVNGDEFLAFDSLSIQEGDSFTFTYENLPYCLFIATVLKKDVHLDCLMPSLLAGVGPVKLQEFESLSLLNEYLESDDALSLDCKSITKKIREFSLKREDISEAMIKAGSEKINFKVN